MFCHKSTKGVDCNVKKIGIDISERLFALMKMLVYSN
jgi:hypothetical protein